MLRLAVNSGLNVLFFGICTVFFFGGGGFIVETIHMRLHQRIQDSK